MIETEATRLDNLDVDTRTDEELTHSYPQF